MLNIKVICPKMNFVFFICVLQSALQCDAADIVDAIKNTFYFDLSTGMNVGDILAWRISKDQTQFKPIPHQQVKSLFHAKGTILILTHRAKRTWQFYYWSGNEVLLEDKQILVKYTMLFYLSALEHYDKTFLIYISREQEGIETFSFEETKFGLIHKRQVIEREKFKSYQTYHNTLLPSNLPNLYAIRGKEFTHIRKVPLHADWLNVADACLILEVGIYEKGMVPINILCGPNSNDNAQIRSEQFAQKFYHYWDEYLKTHFYIRKLEQDDSVKLKQFEDIVRAGNLHNPYEGDDPGDRYGSAEQFVNARNKATLFHFDKNITKHDIPHRPIHSGLFIDNHGAYILDTKSAAGIFLIIGESASNSVKNKAVEAVENYLDKETVKELPTRFRIIKRNAVAAESCIDFNIQLADWPSKSDESLDKFW